MGADIYTKALDLVLQRIEQLADSGTYVVLLSPQFPEEKRKLLCGNCNNVHIPKHLRWFYYVWWEVIHNSAKEVMWTLYFLLLLLLYNVGIDTRDARVICYAVSDNIRIAIRGVRDNIRSPTGGTRNEARRSIRDAGDNTRIFI
ncbi:hypothetical protein P5673_027629 [Acropora cervicornis]|uniref:Uncharacterized protein n=1 Tax=Acropora cervicornis TaxID=6130 RepID=A0AAD9PYK9_ACRCE|nr:hypothetical protein P5673_027629 [Acropora cervicornis]